MIELDFKTAVHEIVDTKERVEVEQRLTDARRAAEVGVDAERAAITDMHSQMYVQLHDTATALVLARKQVSELQAEVAKLNTDIESLEPRFLPGDRIMLKSTAKPLHMAGSLFKVTAVVTTVTIANAGGMSEEVDANDLDFVSHEPERRWVSVTADEMRKALTNGERVSCSRWPPGYWLEYSNGSFVREGESRLHEFLRAAIAGTDDQGWQVWRAAEWSVVSSEVVSVKAAP